jgi:two-component system, OmpR family, sensor kinase
VSQERLTRQELSWLLAQEARGAAKALREGVTQLKPSLAPSAGIEIRQDEGSVETTLDTLDDAINRLSELQTGPQSRARRGRIDLAALLVQLAPHARIVMEPGAGTEVFGEEAELNRMLLLLVGQTHGTPTEPTSSAAPEVHIRRQEQWVRIAVALGPDTSASAELERRWLSRMATRYGGRLELEGGMQSLLLPADGASDQREVVELRKELEQAQQLGEAYARELAAVFATGDLPSDRGEEPAADVAAARFDLLISTCSAVLRLTGGWFEGLRADLTNAGQQLGNPVSLAQPVLQRLSSGLEMLGELRRVAECPRQEAPRRVNVADLAREVATGAEARAARHTVKLAVEIPRSAEATTRPSALTLMLRALLDQAIAATPRDGQVTLELETVEGGFELRVSDGGPAIVDSARADLLAHRLDPTSVGRPAGPALLVASTAATYLGAPLSFGEISGRTYIAARLRDY